MTSAPLSADSLEAQIKYYACDFKKFPATWNGFLVVRLDTALDLIKADRDRDRKMKAELADDIKQMVADIEANEESDMTEANADFYEAMKEICMDMQIHLSKLEAAESHSKKDGKNHYKQK